MTNQTVILTQWDNTAGELKDRPLAPVGSGTFGMDSGLPVLRTPSEQRIASGALFHTREAKSANFTVTSADFGKLFDITTGTSLITATLPTASDVPGFLVGFHKADLTGGHVITSPATRRLRFQSQMLVIFSDGTNWLLKEPPLWPWISNPGKYSGIFDDAEIGAGNSGFVSNGTGLPTFQLMDTANEVGVGTWPTLASSGGSLNLRCNQSAGAWANLVAALYFEHRFKLDTLPDGTNDYKIWMGVHDGTTSSPADGVGYFALDRTYASPGNWYYCTANNSTRTETDTGVAADTSYHTFRILSIGTSAKFWIDDTYIGEITSNIPTTSTRNCSPWHVRRVWVAGTAPTMRTDWGITYAALASMR